jgi:tyrosyl-tRNA synthetase
VTRADGTKFGKSAAGERVWLDPNLTSPYKFYQFWINCSDDDAARYLRVFSLLPKEEIEQLEEQHRAAPHTRILQQALARDITVRVHSEQDYQGAVRASEILFGGGTTEALKSLTEKELLSALDGVPRAEVSRDRLSGGVPVLDILVDVAGAFASKGEARRMIKGGGVSVNKEKVADTEGSVTAAQLIADRYLLVQRGKKNYYLVVVQ